MWYINGMIMMVIIKLINTFAIAKYFPNVAVTLQEGRGLSDEVRLVISLISIVAWPVTAILMPLCYWVVLRNK